MNKIKLTNILDHHGNVNEIRAIIRVLVWGIVEQVKINDLIDFDEEICDNEITENELPIQFTSNKSKSSRKKRKKKHIKPIINHGLSSLYANELILLPKPKFNKTLLESNIYKMISCISSINDENNHNRNIVTYVYTRTLGVGSSLPSGSTLLMRVIGCSNHQEHCEICNYYKQLPCNQIEINLSLIISLSSDELYNAYLMVQKDEEYLSSRDIPENVHIKYWNQRYRILSLYDKGIKLDAESWFSITPESIAKHVTSACIGRAIERKIQINHILDCFSGCGGNTIPFAKKSKIVTSIDNDMMKLQYLKYNASIYECDQNISLICADVYQFLSSLISKTKLKEINDLYNNILLLNHKKDDNNINNNDTVDDNNNAAISNNIELLQGDNIEEVLSDNINNDTNNTDNNIDNNNGNNNSSNNIMHVLPDLIILSPPWGGPGYVHVEEYDLHTMLTCGCGIYLAMLAAAVCPNILYLLPYNTSNEQLIYISEIIQQPYVIEDISINRVSKLKAIYYGPMTKCIDSNKLMKKRKFIKELNIETFHNSNSHQHFDESKPEDIHDIK